jgi:outer membrane usher protein
MASVACLPALALAADPADPIGPTLEPAQVSFDPIFTGKIDLSRFERGNITLPGVYNPEVIVNGESAGALPVAFRMVWGSQTAHPCFDEAMLVRLGFDLEKFGKATAGRNDIAAFGDKPICSDIGRFIPSAHVDFDEGEQQLHISIPQLYMSSRARGYVSPEYWDSGEPGALLDYSANAYRLSTRGSSSTTTYVGLNGGVNLEGWRLRHSGSANIFDGKVHYQNNLTFAQHDLTELKAQLTLGDSYTSGELLDSVRIRGAIVASDTRMLPSSLRGYAPVIRGVAESNARVVIKQRGYVIYETTVVPGPYAIDDLYPSGYGGDLDVEVTEADGRTRRFSVPFAAQPRLLRAGMTRFALAAGQVNELSLPDTPFIFQGTVQRGINNGWTFYGGVTASNSYFAPMVGSAINLPAGAFSLDVTSARAPMRTLHPQSGVSTRISYSKNLEATGTNFALAAYRFSTRGYLSVIDAARLRYDLKRGRDSAFVPRQRSRFDVNISQPLGSAGGMLNLLGSANNYWNSARRVEFTLGYSNQWRLLQYTLSVQRSKFVDPTNGRQFANPGRQDTTYYLTLSLPLGVSRNAPQIKLAANRDASGYGSTQLGVTGNLGDTQNISYGVTANRNAQVEGAASDVNLSGGYRASYGSYSASLGFGAGRQQASVTASGGVVLHRHGLTLSQSLGETNGIIHAPGAKGVLVTGYSGVRLDGKGNAIVPYLQPYQVNTVQLDTLGASDDIELESSSATATPRAGALVRLNYETTIGQALTIHALQKNSNPLPFGASVTDETGRPLGVVGQGSKAFIRAAALPEKVIVSWGASPDQNCGIRLTEVPANMPNGAAPKVEAECVASGEAAPK